MIGGNEYILASTPIAQSQLPSQTKITFSPTSSEVKVKFKYGTSAWTWHGHSICITKPVMVSETYYVDVCDGGEDKYRFGFNGQEKVNEISGIGNHNTAEFWEYDTRLGRRWNLDPVDQVSISNYATFANNPIYYNDPLGNTIKPTVEGNEIIQTGLNTLLNGKQNPIEYKNGILEYNNNVDISSYSPEQQLTLNRYKELIENTDVIINVDVVDRDMKIFDNGKLSLEDIGANGSTQMFANVIPTPLGAEGIHIANKLEYKSMVVDVFIARNPFQNINGQATDIQDSKRFAGFTSLHEITGHGYELLRLLKSPQIQHIGIRGFELLEEDKANIRVEYYDNFIRKEYRKHMQDNSLDGETEKHNRYIIDKKK